MCDCVVVFDCVVECGCSGCAWWWVVCDCVVVCGCSGGVWWCVIVWLCGGVGL